MKHADPKLDTHTSPPSRACDAGRKVERCVVEVVASSLRGFAYSPPVLSSHANNSCKGDGRENERSSGKKAARWERRGAYRRPRSTTVGIHRVGAEATPPRPSPVAPPPYPRRPELAGYVSPPSPDPCNPELFGHAGHSVRARRPRRLPIRRQPKLADRVDRSSPVGHAAPRGERGEVVVATRIRRP
uniref:Uncharacterized protein n=1 Tax=Oryza nivara TaxID=4536 RepID=A0A0E0IN92_ORYNI